jgi:hypothetical protein
MSVFAFCWGISGAPEDDPRQTYVEFALEPTASGTRLTVTESGFAQLPEEWLEPSYQGNFQIGSGSFALFLPVLAGYPWRRSRADEAFAVGLIATGVTTSSGPSTTRMSGC